MTVFPLHGMLSLASSAYLVHLRCLIEMNLLSREPRLPCPSVVQGERGHHQTLPLHDPLKVGTLSAILSDVAQHHGMTRAELLRQLFDDR